MSMWKYHWYKYKDDQFLEANSTLSCIGVKDYFRLWPMREPLSSQLIVAQSSWWICSVTFSVFISSALILAKWWYSGLLARRRPPRPAHTHTPTHTLLQKHNVFTPRTPLGLFCFITLGKEHQSSILAGSYYCHQIASLSHLKEPPDKTSCHVNPSFNK